MVKTASPPILNPVPSGEKLGIVLEDVRKGGNASYITERFADSSRGVENAVSPGVNVNFCIHRD